MTKLAYVATPYSHESKFVKYLRGVLAEAIGAKLISQGFHIFGPIAESSQYTKHADNIGGSWDFWEAHDKMMLEKCDVLFVVKLKGWDKSVGVQAEIEHAKKLGIPVKYFSLRKLLPELKEVL